MAIMKKGRSREQGAAVTRQQLLDAGFALLAEQPAGNVLSHVKAQAVASRAGVTIGAFYHHWPTQAAYVESLLDYALANDRSQSIGAALSAVDDALEAEATFAETIMAAANANLAVNVSQPLFPVQLLLTGLAKSEPDVRDRLERLYGDVITKASPLYESMLLGTGRELRPPITMELFAGVFAAAAEGLAMRDLATPGAMPPESFGWIALALVPVLTREPGDERDVAAYLSDEMPGWAEPPAGSA